ncbi:MAG: aspartate/glutamate racemase family protein, partial [Acidobacteriota bacterium]
PTYKRIGILGGMSPESTAEFYELLIKKHLKTFSNDAYPEIIIFSVNFDKVLQHQDASDTGPYVQELSKGLSALASAGVDFIVIPSNTVHKVLEELRAAVSVPILSIVDTTLDQANKQGLHKLLLLGTKQTMSGTFYQKEAAKRGIDLTTPTNGEQDVINTIIFEELVLGNEPSNKSKQYMLEIMGKHSEVDAIILGCTELQMIIKPGDTPLPLLDTLEIQVEATLKFASS